MEIITTLRTRKYRGKLTLWEFHIWRLYKKYVEPKITITNDSKE